MSQIKPITVIVSACVVAVVGLLIAAGPSLVGSSTQSTESMVAGQVEEDKEFLEIEDPSESYKTDPYTDENYRQTYETRAKNAFEAVKADSRVKPFIKDFPLPSFEFDMTDNEDKVKVKTWKSVDIAGSWSEGYTMTYKEGKVVDAIVDKQKKSVESLTISDRPDIEERLTYTENQKRLIGIALEDPVVQERLAGKTELKDYFIGRARDHGVGDNAWILFSTVDAKEAMLVTVNQASGEVVRVLPWYPINLGVQ